MSATVDADLEAIRKSVKHYLAKKSPAECNAFCRAITAEFDRSAADGGDTESVWVTVPDSSDAPEAEPGLEKQQREQAESKKKKRGMMGMFCCTSSAARDVAEFDSQPEPREPPPVLTIDHKQVDALVDALLADPSFGSIIPDYIEKMAYTMAVDEVLKTICDSVLSVHGTDVIGTHVRVKEKETKKFVFPKEALTIERRPIELLVEEMLKDPDINLSMLPDAIERKVWEGRGGEGDQQ